MCTWSSSYACERGTGVNNFHVDPAVHVDLVGPHCIRRHQNSPRNVEAALRLKLDILCHQVLQLSEALLKIALPLLFDTRVSNGAGQWGERDQL